MNLTLRYAARSDRGLVRDGNQDSVYAGPRLLAVADGMGGMAAGDVASNIVIAAMAPLDEDVPGEALLDALRASVETANQHLRATVEANPQMEGMGTTLTALLFAGSRAGLVHIGDSRAYLLRNGEFTQITKDDTYVQMLVDEGRISSEEAGSHPQRSLLTRAMDGRDVEPEYSIRTVLPGDRYLLCSDGLSGVVSEETIHHTLQEYREPQECVERLIALALRGGGPDNISVIVADATDEDIVESTPVVGGAAARDPGAEERDQRESTPATRASALTTRPPAPELASEVAEPEPDRPRRRPIRSILLVVVLLALLGGGLWYGWSFTQSGYYVGVTEDGRVAVFRGVPGRVAGLELSTLYQTSDYTVDDLRAHAQERVRQGVIRADTAEEAVSRMIELLHTELKPLCPSPTPSPTVAPTTPSPRPSKDPTPEPSGTASARPSTSPTSLDPSSSPDVAAAASATPDAPRFDPPPLIDPPDCRVE